MENAYHICDKQLLSKIYIQITYMTKYKKKQDIIIIILCPLLIQHSLSWESKAASLKDL